MSRISRSSQADAIRAFPQTERRQVSCLSLTETPTRTHVLWKSLNTHIQTHFSVRAYSRYITCSKKSDRIWILINCYWHTNNRPSVTDLVRFERFFSSGSSGSKNSYSRRSIVRAGRIKKKICSRTFLFQTGHSLLCLSWVETLYSMRLITSLLFLIRHRREASRSLACYYRDRSYDTTRHDTTRHDTRLLKELVWFEWARTKDSFHFSMRTVFHPWVCNIYVTILSICFMPSFLYSIFSFFSTFPTLCVQGACL